MSGNISTRGTNRTPASTVTASKTRLVDFDFLESSTDSAKTKTTARKMVGRSPDSVARSTSVPNGHSAPGVFEKRKTPTTTPSQETSERLSPRPTPDLSGSQMTIDKTKMGQAFGSPIIRKRGRPMKVRAPEVFDAIERTAKRKGQDVEPPGKRVKRQSNRATTSRRCNLNEDLQKDVDIINESLKRDQSADIPKQEKVNRTELLNEKKKSQTRLNEEQPVQESINVPETSVSCSSSTRKDLKDNLSKPSNGEQATESLTPERADNIPPEIKQLNSPKVIQEVKTKRKYKRRKHIGPKSRASKSIGQLASKSIIGSSSINSQTPDDIHDVVECITGYFRGKVHSLPKHVQGQFDDEFIKIIIEVDKGTSTYATIEEFLDELKMMKKKHHEQFKCSRNIDDQKLYQMTVENLKEATKDVDMARICIDCVTGYYNGDDDWFTQLCRNPHALVWAQVSGFPFWPAKIIRNVTNNQVLVKFFGTYDTATLSKEACVLLTRNYIGKRDGQKMTVELQQAIDEVMEHTRKLNAYYNGSKSVFADDIIVYDGNPYLADVKTNLDEDQDQANVDKDVPNEDEVDMELEPSFQLTYEGDEELQKILKNKFYQPKIMIERSKLAHDKFLEMFNPDFLRTLKDRRPSSDTPSKAGSVKAVKTIKKLVQDRASPTVSVDSIDSDMPVLTPEGDISNVHAKEPEVPVTEATQVVVMSAKPVETTTSSFVAEFGANSSHEASASNLNKTTAVTTNGKVSVIVRDINETDKAECSTATSPEKLKNVRANETLPELRAKLHECSSVEPFLDLLEYPTEAPLKPLEVVTEPIPLMSAKADCDPLEMVLEKLLPIDAAKTPESTATFTFVVPAEPESTEDDVKPIGSNKSKVATKLSEEEMEACALEAERIIDHERRMYNREMSQLRIDVKFMKDEHKKNMYQMRESQKKSMNELKTSLSRQRDEFKKLVADRTHLNLVDYKIELEQAFETFKKGLRTKTFCLNCLEKDAILEPSCPCNFANYCSTACRDANAASHLPYCAVQLNR